MLILLIGMFAHAQSLLRQHLETSPRRCISDPYIGVDCGTGKGELLPVTRGNCPDRDGGIAEELGVSLKVDEEKLIAGVGARLDEEGIAVGGPGCPEPATHVENTQLIDSEIASNAENATISKSAVQSLYKVCQEFPELQPLDFPAPYKNTLKRSFSISDIGRCKLQGNRDVANQPTLDFSQGLEIRQGR